ncbi:MAG: c-type cytochrome [Verrucomicrobiae bacterium]|nr:c-type cytochrome [Verrucomicrobiae bacterium]
MSFAAFPTLSAKSIRDRRLRDRRPLALALAGGWMVLGVLSAAGGDPRTGFRLPPTPTSPKAGLPPLETIPAPDRLPNYIPGERWGVQGEAITVMQKPLTPGDSARRYVVPEGFEMTLFAHEPDIFKPICFAWDERGRLWIAETRDYPNELQPPGEGRDRITIAEDTDGDGRADRFTVFADRLSIPTTFAFAEGGIIVIHSGETVLLRDTNGDDRADSRKVLFEGWNMSDTHATASNLRMGPDGWMWGVVGYSGFRGSVGGREHRFGQGFFRFRPGGSAMEFIRSSNNNTWGLAFDENGIAFGSTANGNAYMYMPIANRYYEAVQGWSVSRVESIADSQDIHPITTKVRQVDWHGRYTAGAGAAIYTARSFPMEYWNRVGFVCEPTGHLIGQFGIEPRGADFVARNLKSFVASDDEWASPVMAEVGPDGALWVSDWYNYIIQHNPVPEGFENGKGNAYETSLRDKTHGRIYRVVHRDSKPTSQPPRLDRASPADLVATLGNGNLLWRNHAQRLLVERGRHDVVPGLLALVRDRGTDSIGLNAAANHALWTLAGLGALDDPGSEAFRTGVSALRHPAAGVRRNAAAVLPRHEAGREALLASGVLGDADGQVRLATLLALAEMPPSEAAGAAVFAALNTEALAGDKWLNDGATAAGARHAAGFLRAAMATGSGTAALPGNAAEAVRRIAGHHAASAGWARIQPYLEAARTASVAVSIPVFEGFAAQWPRNDLPTFTPEQERMLVALMNALPEDAGPAFLALAEAWQRRDLFAPQIAALARELTARLGNPALTDAERVRSATQLIGIEDTETSLQTIVRQIDPRTSPELATEFIRAAGLSRLEAAAGSLLGVWEGLTPASRRAVVLTLTRRPDWTLALLRRVEEGRLVRSDVPAEVWGLLRRSRNREIGQLARSLDQAPSITDMQVHLDRIRPLTEKSGDVVNGKRVYVQNCAVCHVMDGEGVPIGPDLTGIGERPKAEFYLDIIDPNRSVEANYRLWTVTTRDDESVSGRLDSESRTTIEILDLANQKHVIQRADIRSLEASPLSIMPSGFEELPDQDLIDLFEYLASSRSHP